MSLEIQEPAHVQSPAGSAVAAVAEPGAGSIPPDRTHWGFVLGLEAHRLGQPECPFLPRTMAAAQFAHGWRDAEEDARRADVEADLRFEMTYCQE